MKKEKLNINITVDKDTELFNPYNKEQLSDELSNYIYNCCKGTPTKRNIKINILHNYNISEEEKKEIIDAIRANYGIDIQENILQFKYDLGLELLLILIGTILLILSKLLTTMDTYILQELISIFGCVMIWEAAYNFIFKDIKKAIENKRLKKLTEAKISFKQAKD